MTIKPRHPEKVNKPVNPIKKKPDWIRSKLTNSKEFFLTKTIVNQNNFQFQTDLVDGRKAGTISFTGGGGNNTSLASLTTIKISKFAASTNLILDYLQTLVGEYVMFAQVDDLNNFGIYKLDSLTQDVTETDFYNANFHGFIRFRCLTSDLKLPEQKKLD